jgi:ADP-ribose pyrophosphatase
VTLNSYLDALPEAARASGRADAGEVELRRAEPGDPQTGVVFADEWVTLVRDPVVFPDGSRGTYLRIFERAALDGPLGVVVLAERDGAVLLRRVYRHALRAWSLEFPRGMREPGESVEVALHREAEEETGHPVVHAELLGRVSPNSGLLAGEARVYRVVLGPRSRRAPAAREALGEVQWLDATGLRRAVAHGDIVDGFTLAALAQYWARAALQGSERGQDR